MPLYEYHCSECGAEFEALVSFSQADAVQCEHCLSPQVERLNSSFAAAVPGASAEFQGCYPSCGPSS
jgi:putative FmdB family regulatory protein